MLSSLQRIDYNDVEHIHFYVDQHTTATDGKYELKESLDAELNIGTYNWNYSVFSPPVFSHRVPITLTHCDSSKTTLIRAADIVANRIYYLSVSGNIQRALNLPNGYVIVQP